MIRRRIHTPQHIGDSAFTPYSLGSLLVGLWDAERTDLITHAAGLVGSWRDSIGGYDLVQAVSGAKPVWSNTSFDGRAGVTFDGTDDELTLTGVPSSFPAAAVAGEIWAVLDQATIGTDAMDRSAVAYGGASTVSRGLRRTGVSNTNRASTLIGNGSGTGFSNNLNVDFSGRHVVRSIIGATVTNTNIDGVAGSNLSEIPATATTRLRFGATSAAVPGNFWLGGIAMVAFTLSLTTAQVSLMYSYLNARI